MRDKKKEKKIKVEINKNESKIESAEESVEQDTEAVENEAEDRVAELERQLAESQDKYQRALAEMENMRKRQRKNLEDATFCTTQDILKEIFIIIDTFKYASESLHEDACIENWREGFEKLEGAFKSFLGGCGVEEMAAEGEPFNPNYHEAMFVEESSDVPPNTVLAVLEKGYCIGERVLKPARVKISKAPGTS